MKQKLSTIPFFVWLLPVFFVVHGFVEFLGFASFSNLTPMLLTYLASATVLFLLFYLVYRNPRKAGMMTFSLMASYLFFGAAFDFLKANSPVKALYKYSVLLTAMGLVLLVLFIWLLRTKKEFQKATLYLNMLLLIFLLFDATIATTQNRKAGQLLWKGEPNSATGKFPDSCKKPDIYFIIFDSFASTYALQQVFGFDNSKLDSFFKSRNFHVLSHSKSNYDATSFSMSSAFNLDYLHWLTAAHRINHKDYIKTVGLIYDNEMMRILQGNGYSVQNYSIFDIKSHPSPYNNYWKSVNANILSESTLGTRLITQFRWWFERYPVLAKTIPFFFHNDQMANNNACIENTIEESATQRSGPRFVYSHLLMPHFPYYYDKNGQPVPWPMKDDIYWHEGPDNFFTGFVQYTNKVVEKMVDAIQKNTNNQAVIIVMGDHGYNMNMPDDGRQLFRWNNLNAVYFPDQQYGAYKKLNDSVTNVNQFRILFNTLFAQRYPMLKDSLIRIRH